MDQLLFYNYKMFELLTGKITTIKLPKPLGASDFYKVFELLNEHPVIYGVVYYPDSESLIKEKEDDN